MMADRLFFLAMAFLAFHSRYITGKSLAKAYFKDHNIKKRSSFFLWQDTCPPPDFLSVVDVKCKDMCHSNDDCLGNLLCCYNGCKMCMEPVLPPPVIDWLGSPSTYHRGFAAGGVPESNNIDVDLKEPHYEEIECAYKGKTYARGESFFKGCHKCQCRDEGISCEVGPCKTDINPNQGEHSGDASSVDVSRLNHVEALELSGEDENHLQEYPTKTKMAKLEYLKLHRGESEGQANVRVIPRKFNPKRTSGNGEGFGYSGQEETGEGSETEFVNSKEEVELSGEEENSIGNTRLTTSTESTELSENENIETKTVRRMPKLRRILRRQPKMEELYKNVLII